jgi:putative glutamine amidotransferase
MSQPLIGITGRRWPAAALRHLLPSSFLNLQFDLHFSDYPASVAAAGGLPVELTRDADVEEIVERIDGLILSGGADIEPQRYGAEPDEQLGSIEPDRDEWEFKLFHAARSRGVPILGICRGAQLTNVALGGTLRQHVDADEGSGHPMWDANVRESAHEVVVRDGSLLSSVVASSIGVNSLHHQTIDRLGKGLVATAHAPDGVIEAVELPGEPILAVQWHPELLGGPDPTFCWIVAAAKEFRASVNS